MPISMSVNLKDIRNFVESDTFANFLLENTSDFSIAAFILQTCLDRIDILEEFNEE